ncbi:polyribonucleotide nucleotidyltransferase [Artemisia annua]|uniref:Polyribonucleotide nucleotidyltransferase n=1 Tax=Artemisia annua TaxID=35608 RepID=A0A2U1MPG7_ARTAN|nr:polyribonucleotide nucleotidyltransferase [Artemisia annua]
MAGNGGLLSSENASPSTRIDNTSFTTLHQCKTGVETETVCGFVVIDDHQEEREKERKVREQGVLQRGGTRHTHCVCNVEGDLFICRRTDALLVLTLLLVSGNVLSYDGVHPPDSLAVTAAGVGVPLPEVSSTNTIAGVRIGLIGDKFVVNPTTKEMEDSKLDLLLAGSESGILMIEGYCDFLPEEKLVQAPLAKASAPSL